jgi:septal ring factor EnvC (AmiA/AmiB activator)
MKKFRVVFICLLILTIIFAAIFAVPVRMVFAGWEEDHLNWLYQECAWRKGKLFEVNEIIRDLEARLNWFYQECAWREGKLREVNGIVRDLEDRLNWLYQERARREGRLREIRLAIDALLLVNFDELKVKIALKEGYLRKIKEKADVQNNEIIRLTTFRERLLSSIGSFEETTLMSEVSEDDFQRIIEEKDTEIQILSQKLQKAKSRQEERRRLQVNLRNLRQELEKKNREIQELEAALKAEPVIGLDTFTQEEEQKRQIDSKRFETLFD